MARIYPVVAVRRPACLKGLSNGELPSAVLVSIDDRGGRLVAPAALAWEALCAAARGDGFELHAVSAADTYRPLAIQRRIFLERYSPDPIVGQPTKRWEGHTWWKRLRVATAAAPGTSNHGLGLAVDVGLMLDGVVVAITWDPDGPGPMPAAIDWLLAHAPAYGWSWETVPEEPWHIRYVAGDEPPPAVLAYGARAAVQVAPTVVVDQEVGAMRLVRRVDGDNEISVVAERTGRGPGVATMEAVHELAGSGLMTLPSGAPDPWLNLSSAAYDALPRA